MKRDTFDSKFGVLAAAAGSAIGLGNIWRFPYIVGKNGGAAFIFVYLICVIVIGLPVMIAEFTLGRKTEANAVEAFKKLAPKKPWYLGGVLSVSAAFIILSFYAMIAGWIFAYISRAATGKLTEIAPAQLGDYFDGLSSKIGEPIFWTFAVLAVTALIVVGGIQKGVEKYSKILMPILLGLLFVLMLRSLTLEGAAGGIEFLFKPDFSQLTTHSILEALGHAFYSLSLGMGIIITYGSYIQKKESIVSLALQVTIADTLIALLAGLVIFPAVFAYGLEPNAGPALIFVTLPAVFHAMPLGSLFATLFFMLIAIAAITSTISLLEVVVAFVSEQCKMERKKATILTAGAIFLVSIPSILSFGVLSSITLFDMTFFDLVDFIASNIFLPLGAIVLSVFVGWVWKTEKALQEITSDGLYPFRQYKIFRFILRYLAPVMIFVILLYSTGIIK